MKTMLSLYIDAETKELAKSKGLNLSKCFQEFLNINLEQEQAKLNQEQQTALLKSKLAQALAEAAMQKEENERLNKKLLEKKTAPKERFVSTGITMFK